MTDPLFGVVLLALALLPRLYIALSYGAEPVWDGHYYDFGARRIAAGFGYSDDFVANGQTIWHPWCHYPVGYSAVLGTFYHLFGASVRTAAVMDAVIGALVAVATWWLAGAALSRSRSRLAGLLVALHPGLLLYSALTMTEPLAALLTLVAFGLATRSKDPWRGAVLGALVLGASALVRPQALLCAPFLAARIVLPLLKDAASKARALVTSAASVLVIGLVCLVPVLPWTARNCRVMDGCALVSTNAGWNLAIGAFPRATGRFETLHSSDGCREVTGQVQQDRCWFNYGVEEIKEHPGHWLALIPAKLGFTFDHESFPVEYLHEARPELWPEPRRSQAREFLTFVHRLFVAVAALGCVGCVTGFRYDAIAAAFRDSTKRRALIVQGVVAGAAIGLAVWGFAAGTPIFWPLVVFLASVPWLPLPGRPPLPPALMMSLGLLLTTALAHAAFFGEDRYHVVVTPIFCLFAAAALRMSEPSKVQTRQKQNGEL